MAERRPVGVRPAGRGIPARARPVGRRGGTPAARPAAPSPAPAVRPAAPPPVAVAAARVRAAVAYTVREAALAFRRNGLMSLAAVTTILVTLLLVGCGLILSANLHHLARVVEGQVGVVAYLREGLTPPERDRLVAAARRLPGVRAVTFVGRDVALRRLQATLGDRVALRDVVQTNPLPDSLEIAVTEGRQVRPVAEAVRRLRGVEEVAFGGEVVDRLLAVTGVVRAVGWGLALLLGLVALVIIMNTVRLTILARRQEIEIMQLVGAGGWYVRSPFLMEGAVEGALAILLAAGVLVPAYTVLVERARGALPFLPLLGPADLLPGLLATIATGGFVVGMSGSLLALRRFLQT